MECLKFHLFLALVLIAHTILLSHPVFSSDDEGDSLIQGLNSYRQASKLSPLLKNDQAHCLADKLSDQLDDQPCNTSTVLAKAIPASSGQPFTNYQNVLSKCNIDVNHTTDGVILPVCVPKLVPTLVLTNYTHTPHAKYLNDSKFTGVGVDSEDDWMVVVLTTSTPQGDAASGATPQGSAATTPQGSGATTQGSAAASGGVGIGSGMRSGVCLMTLLLDVALLLTS